MRWDLFWVHRSVIEAAGMDVGFGMFSVGHLLWLTAMIAGIAALTVSYRGGDEHRRDNMRKITAIFVILFEIFKQCTMALTGAPIADYLPLEICSFAEYAMLADAYWPNGRFLRSIFVFLFLPAAVMAISFPTVTVYPAINIYTIHQFVLHAVIAAYIIARYSSGEFRADYMGIWGVTLKLIPLIAVIYWIDLSFHKSFMFLTDAFGNPILEMLWSVSGGRGGLLYVLAVIVFSIGIMHITYGILKLIGLISKLRREKAAA